MPNVIAVVKDDRIRRQIEQYLEELEMEDLRFASFENVKEFQALYFRDRSNDPPPPEPGDEIKNEDAEETEGAELKLFSEIHLIIFALDSIGGKPIPFINSIVAGFKKFNYWPAGRRLLTVMLKYEDDGINKLDIIHPLLDDLVYLPLDRLVFLQKMQIFLSLPKRVSPRFLFNQEVKQPIEISKITKVDRLSDVALAIRNPVPLRKGLPGQFYLHLPGERQRLQVRGKVIRSEPHPELPGQFLVYFSYYGLSKDAMTQIRRMLSKSPRYQSLVSDNRNEFLDVRGMLWDDNSVTMGIGVLDTDAVNANSLAVSINKEMKRVHAFSESSFHVFTHKYFQKGSLLNQEPPKASSELDFYKSPLILSVTVSDSKCLSVDPGPSEEDLFLGHKAVTIFATPEKWNELFDDENARLVFSESVQIASKGRSITRLLILRDVEGKRTAVKINVSTGVADNVVTVELSPATLADIVALGSSEKNEPRLDVLILDTDFMPEDPTSFIEGMRAKAEAAGLIKPPDKVHFLLISDGERTPNNAWLNSRDLLGLFIKPVDVRGLMFLLSEHLNNPYTMFNFKNLGWSSPSLSVHISKAVELEALSEFGATLRSFQRLAPGTLIFLRQSIYENAPNQCLAARIYACEDHPSEKGQFQVFATYFGINDAFLKFARTWIRENYAQQKKID